jgi:ComF family protein
MGSGSRLSTLDDGAYRYNWLRFVQTSTGGGEVCRLCAMRAGGTGICPDCQRDLPWRVTPWRRRITHVDDIFVCFDFGYPIRQLIHRVKYGRDIACARLLGELAAAHLNSIAPPPAGATLFPVPLARGRTLVRGFNQAMEIALPIARAKRLAVDGVSIYKRQGKKAQSTLNAVSRHANIRGAFGSRGTVASGTAIIVDDVLTTGATVSSMAGTLKAAGARHVLAWIIAAA